MSQFDSEARRHADALRAAVDRVEPIERVWDKSGGRKELGVGLVSFVGVLVLGAIAFTLLSTGPAVLPPVTGGTLAPPTTGNPVTTTSEDLSHTPAVLTPWTPEVVVEDGWVKVRVEFAEGSWADLEWREELDLLSGGVVPDGGYVHWPQRGAADFLVRRGSVEDVVSQFGRPSLRGEYPDGRGGTVGHWVPEGWGVGYFGYQFGAWAVLVHDQGADREWAPLLHGEETESGFLRLYADEPLLLAPAPGYSAPYTIRFGESFTEMVELIPDECDQSSPPVFDTSNFVDWCDPSGLLIIRVTSSSHEFQRAVYEGLKVNATWIEPIIGPGSDGEFTSLYEDLDRAKEIWGRVAPASYRMRLSYSGDLQDEVVVLVGAGGSTIESGDMPNPLMTVEEVFERIENTLERAGTDSQIKRVGLRFHPELFYPTVQWLDLGEGRNQSLLRIRVEPLETSGP